MSDTVKLIIEIPKELHEALINGYEEPYSRMFSDVVKNGTPLNGVLDKMSAEIEEMKYPRKASKFDAEYFFNEGVDRALDVVEKYKGTRNDRSK